MENSPKPRNPSCLTLGKKHRLNDSPKTPIRTVNSPDCFNTPPSLRHNCDSPCSTPITRKRSHFLEESPSQDCENVFLLSSQDIKPNILDVGWKWDESPKCSDKPVINRKQTKFKNPTISLQEKRNVKHISKNYNKQGRKDEKFGEGRGFYKFRQELLRIRSMENWSEDYDELDSSLKENRGSTKNIGVEIKLEPKKDQTLVNDGTINALKCEVKHNNVNTNDNKHNNLFDDSDTDNLLVQLTQKVEAEIKPENKIDQKKETIACYNKTKELLLSENIAENDSFDDILLSLPLDDKDTKKSEKFEIVPKTLDQSKSSFGRYNSMPSSSLSSSTLNNCEKTLVRHNSMPGNEKNTIKPNVIAPGGCSGLNIAESNKKSGSFSRSTTIPGLSEEIERRRQEAKQRLMITMQRKLQQQKQSQMK